MSRRLEEPVRFSGPRSNQSWRVYVQKRVLLLVGLSLLLAVSGFAQTARLGGKVTDAQGGVLPGATVTVTNVASGLASEVVTNAAGSYLFPSLDPGTYRLNVT